jgi:two-component system, LuxR family, sensor kinase FixL
VGQLAASIAHELNQPLCAMVSNAQAAIRMLAMARPDLSEVGNALYGIVSDGKRTGDIVHRSHGLLKRRGIEFRPIQMDEVIQDVAALMHSDALIRRIRIYFELAKNLPMILGDQVQMQQVMLNLMTNAIDATAEVSVGPRQIKISSELTDTHVRVVVRDTGAGISPETASRLFKPFFTTKPHGLGMGRTISHDIIIPHAKAGHPSSHIGWELLLSGYADRQAYENGVIDDSIPLEELEKPH